MKILVLCDDLWHPSEIVERGLAAFPFEGYDFDIVKTAKDILTPNMLLLYDVVLCSKSDCVNAANPAPWYEAGVTEVGPAELAAYVENGGGFLSLHSTNTVREIGTFSSLTGNLFQGHPPRCEVEILPDAAHPISRGVPAGSFRDEHYLIEVTDKAAQVFCHSRSEAGGTQVGGFTRTWGRGRLCTFTPGHTLGAWTHPTFQALLHNALRWCAKA